MTNMLREQHPSMLKSINDKMASIYVNSLSIGLFLGPNIGSLLYKWIGFRGSCAVVGILIWTQSIINFVVVDLRIFGKVNNYH